MIRILSIASFAALTACATPQLEQHPISITSNPPGAAVSLGAKQICTTPCQFDLRDDFGFFSTYTFTAKAPGYADAVLSYTEPTIFHAHKVVPAEVHFEMKVQ